VLEEKGRLRERKGRKSPRNWQTCIKISSLSGEHNSTRAPIMANDGEFEGVYDYLNNDTNSKVSF